jgi:hypothetical protein
VFVLQRIFRAKRTNLHEKYDDPSSAQASWIVAPSASWPSIAARLETRPPTNESRLRLAELSTLPRTMPISGIA